MSGNSFTNGQYLGHIALWAAATQLQLERWEPLVADHVRERFAGRPQDGALYWRIGMERHFLLVAVHHLLDALALADFEVRLDVKVAQDLADGRDMVEHWSDNMPVFNMTPRTAVPPRASGKRFDKGNPTSGPYDPAAWDTDVGPKILPRVPASELRGFVTSIKDRLPDYAGYFHEWIPSPWCGPELANDRWWPRP